MNRRLKDLLVPQGFIRSLSAIHVTVFEDFVLARRITLYMDQLVKRTL